MKAQPLGKLVINNLKAHNGHSTSYCGAHDFHQLEVVVDLLDLERGNKISRFNILLTVGCTIGQ